MLCKLIYLGIFGLTQKRQQSYMLVMRAQPLGAQCLQDPFPHGQNLLLLQPPRHKLQTNRQAVHSLSVVYCMSHKYAFFFFLLLASQTNLFLGRWEILTVTIDGLAVRAERLV